MLHKNYDNNYNLFNQVGLVKLQFVGRYLGDYEVNALKGAPGMQAHYGQQPRIPSQPMTLQSPRGGTAAS